MMTLITAANCVLLAIELLGKKRKMSDEKKSEC